MFCPALAGGVPFWPVMLFAISILAGSAFILDRRTIAKRFAFKKSYLLIAPASAALLYLIFYIGRLTACTILPFAETQIAGIYSTKDQADTIFIGLMLLLWIGPGEEIFWRGFVQYRLIQRVGPIKAWIITSLIYTAVHIWSFNLLLIGASMICGLFWGYMFYRYKSIWPALISHALWDVIIFVIIPL